LAGGAIEGCTGKGKRRRRVCRQTRHLWQLFRRSKIRSTSKFGASGTGCCNVRASNFRPAKIRPATGNLNVDNLRIAGLVSRQGAELPRDGWESETLGMKLGRAALLRHQTAPTLPSSTPISRTRKKPRRGAGCVSYPACGAGLVCQELRSHKKLEGTGIQTEAPVSTSANASKLRIAYITDPWGTYIELTEGLAPAR